MAGARFFSGYGDLEGYLGRLGLFHMKPGLERMRAVLGDMGLARPSFGVVQVVGTNGKGSTSAMLAALACSEGLSTGLHCSPHFVSVRERVRVDGRMLEPEFWVECGERVMGCGGEVLSYFEFVTCLAVQAFALCKVDVAVMETGLGGSYDATTALAADAVVFTPIALDHCAVLGDTLSAIAADKAGAIRPGRPVITGPQSPAAMRELERVAGERGAPLWVTPGDMGSPFGGLGVRPALAGPHQEANARLALYAWQRVRGELCGRAEAGRGVEDGWSAALLRAWMPGRMQEVAPRPVEAVAAVEVVGAVEAREVFSPCALGWPPMLLDGAHNAHGLAALGLALAQRGTAPLAVVFSCLRDKDIGQIVPQLRALATGKIYVPPVADNPRALPPEELAALIGLNAVPARSLRSALAMAAGHMAERMPEVFAPENEGGGACRNPLLVCGSLYLLGEVYALRPDCLEPQGSGRSRPGEGSA